MKSGFDFLYHGGMNARCGILCILLLSALPAPASGPGVPTPNWDRGLALSAASHPASNTELESLFGLTRAGQDEALLAAVTELARRDDWPVPALESVLHGFATGLADLPPGSAGPGVMAFLLDYTPRTLVAHDENPYAAVPLFNIRAAAAGTAAAWQRSVDAERATALIEQDTAAFLAAWDGAAPKAGPAYLQALDQASQQAIRNLAEQASGELPLRAELLLHAGLRLGDDALFRKAASQPGVRGLAPALRAASLVFDDRQRLNMMKSFAVTAPASQASLALALWAPRKAGQADWNDWLFECAEDPRLGASAMLALTRIDDPAVRQRLDELAVAGKGLASRRAAQAIGRAARGGLE